MFEGGTWILVLIGAVVLSFLLMWLVKQRRTASTRRKLQNSGFNVTRFDSSVVTGDYLAIDQLANRVAVRGSCQDAAGFVEKVAMSKGERIFSAKRVEFAEINRELDVIEMAGRVDDGKMLVIRVNLHDRLTQDECLTALRALGIGPSKTIDVAYL